MKNIRLQLQWLPQPQFAGYYLASELGYYHQENLSITILPAGPGIVPQEVLMAGEADVCITWLPKALASREKGARLIHIAQIFQRSGTFEISWKDSGIRKPEDWRGKRVGTWGGGNEAELFAAMRKAGIDPNNASDVHIVQQTSGMLLFLNRKIDAAQAMSFNEYAQVLETTDPKTGVQCSPEDISIISFEDVGTAMLQDGLYTTEEFLNQPESEEIAIRFLRASYRGWIFCRDHQQEAVDVMMKVGATWTLKHTKWMMNEVNALVWPSPHGIGIVNPAAVKRTVEIAVEAGILSRWPEPGLFRLDLATRAHHGITDNRRDAENAKV